MLAFAPSSVGKLPQATRWVMKQAAGQPQLISLGKLNRALQGGAVHHHPGHLPRR
jgi:hypothetical protein